MSSVLAAASESDWRSPAPEQTLLMDLPQGTVIIELAAGFAPNVTDNIRTMIEARFFDAASVNRSQDNYVAQWSVAPQDGIPVALPKGVHDSVAAEFFRPLKGLDVDWLDSSDVYAEQVGFVGGFPVASNSAAGTAWLAHCYGMVGVGRDVATDSGNGAELYAVTGHSPRHLDRNVALIGRVLHGMELLTTLPRGSGQMGFYEPSEQPVPINSIRFATDTSGIKVLRTGTDTFRQLVEARRYRADEWFVDKVEKVSLCNIPVPVKVNN